MLQLIECPRDAMQGLHEFIPTELKINYLQQLLKVGFHSLDFGSFVSPKAIPQMRDTAEVLANLDLSQTQTQLLAIVANERGAEQACQFSEIRYLGFPMSVSETFQLRNTNQNIAQGLATLQAIQEKALQHQKKVVAYLSMGFGNPYGDPYSPAIIEEFTEKLVSMGIEIISLADTIGVSKPENISPLFETLLARYPAITFGAHLHSRLEEVEEKMHAAYEAGCRRFDGAMQGFGGCPMATDTLTGNMATELMWQYAQRNKIATGLSPMAFEKALQSAQELFAVYSN
ncbi:MAG: hydroxymethylglutaryl-CoA lyase [Cytophagales bacterium]|nr:MAG: hydroxymethylglutaryl-CoA lyase [Cytophagales bacterium]